MAENSWRGIVSAERGFPAQLAKVSFAGPSSDFRYQNLPGAIASIGRKGASPASRSATRRPLTGARLRPIMAWPVAAMRLGRPVTLPR